MLFPANYIPKGLHIRYNGEKIELTPEQEEVSIYWCQAVGTDYEHHKIFRTNVASLFESIFKGKLNFEEIDFSPVLKHLEVEKENKK